MFTPILASIENLSIGYIVTDMKHDILLINRAASRLLASGKAPDTLEEVVTHLPKRLELLDHVKYCSIEHKSCNFREVELGDRRVRVFLSPIFEGADLRGNVLTLEDITENVEKEHARDQFLSLLVHELRTPLTAIRGNSTLIEDYYKDALKDQGLKEIVADIDSGSQYVLGMVNQFLDMSRLEEGRIQYDLQEFDAVELVRETVRSLEVLAKERDLTLKFADPAMAKVSVVADPGRTKQVLTNLIGNALKFTEKGSVTVALAAKTDMLEVSVTDTGAGIPEESRAGMFQKYFQASNNKLRKDSSKSTGLGLYVTKLTVEGMRGKIFLAKSALNEGSTFTFSLTTATPARLKQLVKDRHDAEHGVQHAPAQDSEHTLL